MKNNSVLKLITISLGVSSLLFGADVPNVGTIQKEIKVPKNVEKKNNDNIEIGGVKKLTPAMSDDKSGKTILIKDFNFEGNTKLSNDELQIVVNGYKNKELNFSDMQKVATLITKAYRDKGYFVARAYIPVQDMSNGVLKINIIEGEYETFNIINNSRVKDSIVQSILDEAKKDKVISTNSLERQLLIANDTPGITISKANVKAGEMVGTSDFDIQADATPLVDGFILGDNYGSRYTGKNRLMGGVNLNSPFFIGDRLSLLGLISNGSDLKYTNIDYSALLLPNGLRGGLGYSYTSYSLAKEYESLDASGYSKDFNINLSYPIIRKRDENLNIRFDGDRKHNLDKISSTDSETKKDITSATTSLDYELSSLLNTLPTDTKLGVAFTYGNLTFNDDSSFSNDEAGADTNGNYSKIVFKAFKNYSFTPTLSIEGTFKYQHALGNKNLDGSEDLSIGGSDGVKVYPTSEASAENGYVATIETKYILPSISSYNHTVGLFYDRARVYDENDNNIDSTNIDLQDAGIGYYAAYDNFFINSHMAWKVNSDQISSEPDYNSKFLVQAGWVF